MTLQPFISTNTISKDLLDLIHMDVCGPMNKASIGGARFFVTFIDDHSRRIFVYFLKHKSEVLDKFKLFHIMAERQTGKKVKCIRSDNGKEFVNAEFEKYLQAHGIKHQLSVPYTPQQNGVAERVNRTLVEMARTIMLFANVKEFLWAEAISTAAYIRNRSITKINKNVTPMEIWSGKKPSVGHLRIFGCKAFALNKARYKKFEARAKEYVFVGYSTHSKAYRLYDASTHKIIESRDVKFDENSMLIQKETNDYVFFNPESKTEEKTEVTQEIVRNEDQAYSDDTCEIATEEKNMCESSTLQTPNDEVQIRRGRGRPRLLRTGNLGRPKKQYQVINYMSHEVKIPQCK